MSKSGSSSDSVSPSLLAGINYRSVMYVVLFFAGFSALYYSTFVHMVAVWFSSDGSHGPLILAVSLYLVWISRDQLRRLPIKPALLPGTVLVASGCFMLFAGKISSTILLQQLSMIPVLLGSVWLLLGFAFVKALLLPIVYLVFLTGLVEELLGNFNIFLQTASAWIAAKLLILYGLPVVLSGIIIDLPHISLIVVKACSGINHLVALMALSVPLAIISNLTTYRKIILVVSSFFIGMFANGLRIAAIGVYSIYNAGVDLHGPNQTLYVGALFFIGMVMLVTLSHLLRTKEPVTEGADAERESIVSESETTTAADLETVTTVKVVKFNFTPLIVIALFFVLTWTMMQFYTPGPVAMSSSWQQFPDHIAGFSSRDAFWMDNRVRPFPADEELARVYTDHAGNRVEIYIGYFEDQFRGRRIIDYRRVWLHEHDTRVTIGSTPDAVVINKSYDIDKDNPPDLYFWYQMDDRVMTSRYDGKFYTFWNGLTKRRTNASIVIIQTSIPQTEVSTFLDELVPMVVSFLRGRE